MSSRTVTLSMAKDYPFSIARDYNQPRTTIQVKLIQDYHLQPRTKIIEKTNLLKMLAGNHFV